MTKRARKSPTPQVVFTFADVSPLSCEKCNACSGKHRAHTCGKYTTRKIQKSNSQANKDINMGKHQRQLSTSNVNLRSIGPSDSSLAVRLHGRACEDGEVQNSTYSTDLSIHALPNLSMTLESPSSKSCRVSCSQPSKQANKKVVKALSALSNSELRQALPTNYGDTIEEIHTVCVSYTNCWLFY